MKTLKILFLTCGILALFVLPSFAASISSETLYDRFIRQIARSRPASFSCLITGDAIERSLARVPQDARTGTPVVRTWYRRDVGQVIRVENVERSFKNLFSAYQNYLGMTGAWIETRGRDWAEFSRQYSMQIISETATTWLARIASLGRDNDSWGEFAFSKNTTSVQSVRFFSRGSLVYSVKNTYGSVSGYWLPTGMTITAWQNGQASSVSRLRFSGYQLNMTIPDSVFSR